MAKDTPTQEQTPFGTGSEDPFRSFVEMTDDLFTAVDSSGCLLYVNPAAERVFGLPPEDCLGRSAFDFVHPDDRERTQEAFQGWLTHPENKTVSFENRQVGVHGEVRDVVWTITRQTSADGQLLFFASCAHDVTALRAAESRSAATESRFRELLRGMLDAVVTIDPYGIIQDVSDSVRDVFGYEPEDLAGRNISVLMPEPHHSRHDEYLARYRETGATWILGTTREFEVVRKDGSRIICGLSVSRIDLPGKEAPMFCGSFRDISARKEAERQLAESEARFRAIFDQEFQFVGLLTPSGTILEVNQAAMDATGVSRGEVIGRPFAETRWWSHSEALQESVKGWIDRAAAGEFIREEVEVRDGDDELLTIDFSLKPVRDEDGRIAFIIPEGRDISDLKRAQQRETAMLRALATIGESAALLAHEIKNPITAVNLALRAVANHLGEDEKSVLEELVGRMQKLEKTIRRTLSFAKPLALEMTRTAVGDFLQASVTTMSPELDMVGVELDLKIAPDCPEVCVDAGLFEELVTNMIRNAIDAMDGAGRLEIRATKRGGGWVEITVEDDGPGIPKSILETLFLPFTTTKEQGTGLGLALSRKIVEEHGGSIEAGRSPLGGARFVIQLPSDARAGE